MAGSMKDIKLRIRSVESTMQITKAMELVASSKLRRAKDRADSTRPYYQQIYRTDKYRLHQPLYRAARGQEALHDRHRGRSRSGGRL